MKGFIFLYVAIFSVLGACSYSKPVPTIEKDSSITTDDLSRYSDTLIGKFDGLIVDTLISEPYGEKSVPVSEYDVYGGHYYKWRVYTTKGTVQDLRFEGLTTRIKFVAEGDVDGDGQEEWGFLSSWPTSNFKAYTVFRNTNGKWEEIVNLNVYAPLINWDMEDEEYKGPTVNDLVEPTDIPGIIKIKESHFVDDVENDIYLDWFFVDSLININHLRKP